MNTLYLIAAVHQGLELLHLEGHLVQIIPRQQGILVQIIPRQQGYLVQIISRQQGNLDKAEH